MTTPNPATEAARQIKHKLAGARPTYGLTFEQIIRSCFEPYMQAAEEMARCLSLLERDHYSFLFPSLARWKELIGEE